MKKRSETYGMSAVLALVSVGCAAVHGGPPADAHVTRYLGCRSSDPNLRIVETKRLPPDAPRFREVAVGGKTQRVSVLDGYRVLYGFEDVAAAFANVKVERSDPGAYAADKDTLIRMQQTMPSTDKVAYRHLVLNGIETHGVDKPELDVGGIVGSYVVFLDADQAVVSLYFVNDRKAATKISDIRAYQLVRDRFLDDLTRCFSAGGGNAPASGPPADRP